MESEVEIVTEKHAPPATKASKPPREPLDPEAAALKKREASAHQIYGRGRQIAPKTAKDKKLRYKLKALESKYKDAFLKAHDAEILLEHESGFLEPEDELERTYKVRQDEVKGSVAVETARKGFELKLLGLGPYVCDYTRNGKGLVLAGRKGHVAAVDWRDGRLAYELQLGETVRAAKWLHNDQLWVVHSFARGRSWDTDGRKCGGCAEEVYVYLRPRWGGAPLFEEAYRGYAYGVSAPSLFARDGGQRGLFEVYGHLYWGDGD